MNKEEMKVFLDIFKKLEDCRRDSETPEQAMDNFETYMKEIINSDNKKE